MKKNIFCKIIASVLSLSLVFSFSGFVSAASHAANGANVIPSNMKWIGESVRDDIHTGVNTEWEVALLEAMDDALSKKLGKYYEHITSFAKGAYEELGTHRSDALTRAEEDGVPEEELKTLREETGNKDETGVVGILDWQSWTHGVVAGDNTPDSVIMDCSKDVEGNTGGDGQYSSVSKDGDKVLIGDNPYGLTLKMDGIPVEYGRYYTMEFDISSTLLREKKHPTTGKPIGYEAADKHAIVKAYDYQSRGGPAAAFESVQVNGKEEAKDGMILIASTPYDKKQSPEEREKNRVITHVKAKFKIPDSKNEWSSGRDKEPYTNMGIMFALGAFDYNYGADEKKGKNESWLQGKYFIENMKVYAGTQYAVKYYDGSTLKATKYVNEYEQAKSLALQKKGYTLDGYINMATGAKYNFASVVERDLNLKAKWVKTKKPKKASFTLKSKKKKKVTVKFKKNKNAKGYQVKYSYSKKFKKKSKYKTKTKNSSSTKTYTIKSLKSSKVLYVKARGYNKDSCGKKVYGKWSKRKSVYVK